MLSICIPVYNQDVFSLAETLSRHSQGLDIPVEIIFMEDGSDIRNADKNKQISSLVNVLHIINKDNVGRAVIRNMLAAKASYPYLLFLDGDSVITNPDFLKKYTNYFQEVVICVGRIYPDQIPSKKYLLHWNYGVFKESLSHSVRQKSPYRNFMSNNFMIPKKILLSIKFNESLSEYGHEDTLFGFELMKNKIKIIHIDNQILHGQLESNEQFIVKSEAALWNLKLLDEHYSHEGFRAHVKLLRFVSIINPVKKIIKLIGNFLKDPLRKRLKKGTSNLLIFDLYKLLFFLTLPNH